MRHSNLDPPNLPCLRNCVSQLKLGIDQSSRRYCVRRLSFDALRIAKEIRVWPRIANILLVIASALFCYVALEYAIFRVFPSVVPAGLRSQLPEVAYVLTQNSKSAYLPHNYIALLGDSNAEGLGDWLLEAEGNTTEPFHSADIIHQLSGQDVVNLGKGGAGSAEAIVLRPSRVFRSSHCSLFPVIEDPQQIFVYFYEGNDIEDNINFVRKVSTRFGRTDAEAIGRFLGEEYAVSSFLRCHWHLADLEIKILQTSYQRYIDGVSVKYCGLAGSERSRIVVGGQINDVPALQGPAPKVPDESIRLGMSVLAQSLSWLRKRFNNLPIAVVYIPSPLTVYRYAGDEVSFCSAFVGSGSLSKAQSERRHDMIRKLVAGISADSGMQFIDATPALRAAASSSTIHGPNDWDHLNKTGYQVLGALVASQVRNDRSAKSRPDAER